MRWCRLLLRNLAMSVIPRRRGAAFLPPDASVVVFGASFNTCNTHKASHIIVVGSAFYSVVSQKPYRISELADNLPFPPLE
mmetsp:Transcript_12788/g.41804  ORF Transcript_12788/g.41804 Transcript_12788/m.41804 type:complete len:81 (+) Transcript_12788:580-822(+)